MLDNSTNEARTNAPSEMTAEEFYGWTSQVYNHITARIPNTEHLLINPFGHAYDEITPHNLIKIDIDGKKLDDTPYPVNEAGYTIHSALHSARPDLQCIAHTHSQNATAICCLEEGFIPLTQMGCMFYDRIGTHEFQGIALDLAERESLIADFGNLKPWRRLLAAAR